MTSKLSHLGALALIMAFTSCASVSPVPSDSYNGTSLRPTGKVLTGKASWYASYTQGGHHTSSGVRLNNNASTAAHKTLPHYTHVKVTNLQNGLSEIVQITDRGPYIQGRIIDVTIGVARRLDFVNAGVVPVKVEIMEPINR